MTDELTVTPLELRDDDGRAATELIVAGFFAVWMVDEIATPEYLENYRRHIRALKARVSPEAALRALQCISRAHPRAAALLAEIERMKALPW